MCYRVDEVVFTKSPRDKLSETEDMTFVDYYERHYAEHIRFPTQPLLRCHMKRKCGEDDIFLVPELVVLTGLDQEMRSDYKVMQQLASATRLTPSERLQVSSALPALLATEKLAQAALSSFDLGFIAKPVMVPAQDLSGECVFTDVSSGCPVDDKGNFQLNGRKVLTSVGLEEWAVVAPEAEKEASRAFVLALVRSLTEMNSETQQPSIHLYGNEVTVESRVREVVETRQPRFLLVLLPRRLKDRYAPIKKLTSTEHCVPSQFVVVPVPEKRFRGVVEKVALQIQAKSGAQLWTVRPSTDFGKYVMVVGIDIYHDLVNRRKSVMGFCATVHPNFSKYYSTAALQASGQEIVSAIGQCFTEALLVFREKARKLPETVIIFRDGVGESQVSGITEFEVASLQRACESVETGYSPLLSYVVVIKKPSAKFFSTGARGVTSPKPGTLVTSTVVPCSGDFYLISHSAPQGVSTPTLYRTVHGSADIEALARLAYKLCHMYYNWPGAVKVPAPVMMAHRLAYFVGQWVHEPVAPSIRSFSFYL
jgi:aubergine-like protein